MVQIKYDRQTRIPSWDQERLSNAVVAVVGAGALGNHVCMGLIGLGVGTIKIYDFDTVEAHNLNRQLLFCENDVGHNKAEVLATRLQERNSSILIVGIDQKIEDDTIEAVLANVDIIVDCVDLIYVRRIINRFCLFENISLVHGGISWFGGQTGIITRETPCVNCIYPQEMQAIEIDIETSCTRKPEPSVVYISQIIAGFMVANVRRILIPFPNDPQIPQGLYKFDFRFHPPLYFEPTKRKEDCECVQILEQVAPKILKKEEKSNIRQKKDSNLELLQFLEDSTNTSTGD